MGRIFNQEFIVCACGCDKLREKYDCKGREHRYIYGHGRKGIKHNAETRKKISVSRRGKRSGENHWNYRGGIKMSGQDCKYISRLKPEHHFANNKGYVLEHRLIWEEYNKATLLPWAHVHHLNNLTMKENKLDNTIENLEAMMGWQHASLHARKDMSNRRCYYCHSNITEFYKGSPLWYKHKEIQEEFICKKCYHRLQN